MANDDPHTSLNWLHDIHEFLFTDIGLDVNQSNRYGFEYMKNNPYTDPWNNKQLKSIGFVNFRNNYSHMLYWKSGHSLIKNILEGTHQVQNGFSRTSHPINETIVIPYKDPVDKFLSAYFTSYEFKEQLDGWSSLWYATGNVTQDNVTEITERCYNKLDAFVDRCLTNGEATAMGNIGDPQWENTPPGKYSNRFDHHFYPIHILLYQALRNRTDRFKLVGLNLDFGPDSFIYHDIKVSKDIPQERKDMLLTRTSANNNFLKMVSQKWKCANLSKVDQVIQMYLLNDYKLIEVLDKNAILQ